MRIRRLLTAGLILVSMFISSLGFAAPMGVPNLTDSIELISPVISSRGDVTVDKSLYISIRLFTEQPLAMDLIKIDSTIVDLEQIQTQSATEYAVSDYHITNLVRFQEILKELSAYKQADAQTALKLKADLLSLYTTVQGDYSVKKTAYEGILAEMKNKYGSNVLTIAGEKPTLDVRFPQLLKAQEEFRSIETRYKLIKPLYDKLFERVIITGLAVKLEGVMPYFNYVVSEPKTGKYKLAIYTDDSAKRQVKNVVFDVKSRQDNVMNILSTFQEELQDLWRIK